MGIVMGSTDSARVVRAEDLVCPGCGDPAVGEPPITWPPAAGAVPEFSHSDGSVLCPDGRGRVGEPVEAAVLEAEVVAIVQRGAGERS